MALPSLDHWDTTRDSLHRASEVLGALRKAFIKPQPNALHLALEVTPTGLTTGELSGGNEFWLDFTQATLNYRESRGRVTTVELQNNTPQAALIAVVSAMPTIHMGVTQLVTRGGLNTIPLAIDKAQSADYAEALYRITTAFNNFRAGLKGMLTPLVVWPHGFDLSMLWFPGDNPDEQTQPHCNFGFSPGSAGLPRPYFYGYVWPRPDDLTSAPLPAPVRWHTEGWTGALVEYDAIRNEAQPEIVIQSLLEQIYQVLAVRIPS
ncbi:MAG: DUF5996 family protein [bacterium]|nr:DUF5996 family protein [bacterium]